MLLDIIWMVCIKLRIKYCYIHIGKLWILTILMHKNMLRKIYQGVICVLLARVRSFKGKRIFRGFHGAFTLINGKEVDKYTPWELVDKL